MANLCESIISKDITFSCDELATKGLESDGIIMNRGDIDFAETVFDTNNPNIIKTIVLKTGKRAYEIVQAGNTPFTGTQSALEVGTYRNTFTHTVSFVVLANDPDTSHQFIDGLANGTFVAILRNKHKGGNTGDGEYQIYGYNQLSRGSGR